MFSTDRMKSPSQSVLDVTQHGIDPFEGRQLRTFPPTASDDSNMAAARILHCVETVEPVGDYRATPCQAGFGIARNFRMTKTTNSTQMHLQWPAVLRRLNGGYERDLIGGTAPPFTGFLSADIGIIDLDTSRQLLFALALQHYRHQFVLEFPGRIVVDADFAGQLQRRGALLTLGQQIDSQEPFPQGQFGAVEDGAGGQRGLVVTFVALVYLAGLECTAGRVTALRTDKTVRPAELVQRLFALCFAAVHFQEFVQSQTFWKLYGVLLHNGKPPVFSRFHYVEFAGSIAEPRRESGNDKWSLIPSLSGGYYSDGACKSLGFDVEFYSQLRLEYRFLQSTGIGFGVGQISNAGIGDKNPGAETVYLSYSVSF